MTAAAPPGLTHVHAGKVRDLYAVAGQPDLVVMVASDRISAYDWVLPTEIPDKGRILTRLSLWWFERFAHLVPHHVVSDEPPAGAPAAWAGRTMVCRRLAMFPVECVARGYLAGSGWAEYRAAGAVCGVALPPGLRESDRLPQPIFTPATKAAVGEHDENISYAAAAALLGQSDAAALRDLTLRLFAEASAVAGAAGILLADTKLEFGRDPETGAVTLADEAFTPDSSRFWPAESWAVGRSPPSYDKQFVRDWLTSAASGWDRGGSAPPPALPADVVEQTRERYVAAYERLTGRRWSD